MDIGETIKRAYASMDAHGYFPAHPCRCCGATLQGEGGDRPAETYAGTYTGLCYKCERSGPYPVGDPLPDGTVRLSYPPHCPSWRRDREEVWAHPDCEECGGSGRHRVSRSDPQGGPYYRHCRSCLERVSAPRRAAELVYLREYRDLLATWAVGGDPLESCKSAALACVDRVFDGRGPYAREPMQARFPLEYRPSRKLPLSVIEYGLKPADLKHKRAQTLLSKFVAALDVEIGKRESA
jgi:hypothetical protein